MTGLDAHQLLMFLVAGWLLNLTPGPDVLYIFSNALRSGRRGGWAATGGILVGCIVHVAAAAVGVGALLAASATAFTVLKWVGATYLLYMGMRMLLARPAPGSAGDALGGADAAHSAGESVRPRPLRTIFMGGFWTNVLNPKVVIFFLAFVPQFIAPGTENKTLAFALLGLLFTVNSIPVCVAWVLAAAWVKRRSGALQQGMRWLDRAAGVMFIGFGLRLALTDGPAA